MKYKQQLEQTTNSSVYKKLLIRTLVIGCTLCSPNKGCNKWGKSRDNRSWKRYRKTQWKE